MFYIVYSAEKLIPINVIFYTVEDALKRIRQVYDYSYTDYSDFLVDEDENRIVNEIRALQIIGKSKNKNIKLFPVYESVYIYEDGDKYADDPVFDDFEFVIIGIKDNFRKGYFSIIQGFDNSMQDFLHDDNHINVTSSIDDATMHILKDLDEYYSLISIDINGNGRVIKEYDLEPEEPYKRIELVQITDNDWVVVERGECDCNNADCEKKAFVHGYIYKFIKQPQEIDSLMDMLKDVITLNDIDYKEEHVPTDVKEFIDQPSDTDSLNEEEKELEYMSDDENDMNEDPIMEEVIKHRKIEIVTEWDDEYDCLVERTVYVYDQKEIAKIVIRNQNQNQIGNNDPLEDDINLL